jgi:hypothetical protein
MPVFVAPRNDKSMLRALLHSIRQPPLLIRYGAVYSSIDKANRDIYYTEVLPARTAMWNAVMELTLVSSSDVEKCAVELAMKLDDLDRNETDDEKRTAALRATDDLLVKLRKLMRADLDGENEVSTASRQPWRAEGAP